MMPFYVFDGVNGRLMTASLRPGKTPTASEIIAIVKRLVKAIRIDFWDLTRSTSTKRALMAQFLASSAAW